MAEEQEKTIKATVKITLEVEDLPAVTVTRRILMNEEEVKEMLDATSNFEKENPNEWT